MARAIRASDIFTPGSYPTHTYVERGDVGLEKLLRQGLGTRGMIVSVSGPSKAGKTVLVERVVGDESLIPLTGARIRHPDDVWAHALDWMGAPAEESAKEGTAHKGTMTVGAKAGASFLGFAKGEASATGALESGGQRETSTTTQRRGMVQVIKEIGQSEFVLLIDDFHYIPRDVQADVAQQLKEAARQETKIVVAAVPHRSDDVIRANTDLRGRVLSVDLAYWDIRDLMSIASIGFEKLNVEIDADSIEQFASEAAGSPQLMQSICLSACFELDIEEQAARRTFNLDGESRRRILERAAPSVDYRTLVTILDAGPKARGRERKTYRFGDGGEGDVYTSVLRAIAADPPRLSFDYEEIIKRVDRTCAGEKPVGSSIVATCVHMSKIALEKHPAQRVLDWDEEKQVLDIPDPYLLFFLPLVGVQSS